MQVLARHLFEWQNVIGKPHRFLDIAHRAWVAARIVS